jgi:hypothetical protein
MLKIIKMFWFILLILSLQSCHNPVGPTIDNVTSGRRDYSWTVDTIKIPFNFLSRITGSGPNDVYAVGQGGGLDETIWHYDGQKWKTDGVSRGISPLCIHSFNKNNVWMAGNEGKIWAFNGIQWEQRLDFRKPNYDVGFQDIWGESSVNIYAVGYADSGDTRKGIILHYDGNKWQEALIPFFPHDFIRIEKDINGTNNYYLLGIAFTNEGTLMSLFEYNGYNTINKIYESNAGIDSAPAFQLIENKLYFTLGKTINSYENSIFRLLINIKSQNYVDRVWGRSLKDIFLLMNDGIAHYNGTDEEYIFRDINASISDAVIFDKEIFFVAADFANNQNLMIKGVLK